MGGINGGKFGPHAIKTFGCEPSAMHAVADCLTAARIDDEESPVTKKTAAGLFRPGGGV